jgi:hypothetical protein
MYSGIENELFESREESFHAQESEISSEPLFHLKTDHVDSHSDLKNPRYKKPFIASHIR